MKIVLLNDAHFAPLERSGGTREKNALGSVEIGGPECKVL